MRGVVELQNASPLPADYSFATAEWTLSPSGAVAFDHALAPGSCRPWVAIERTEAKVPANGRMRYRYEVSPPAGTPPGECRFAILITGLDEQVKTAGGTSIGIAGQVALIVYVAVGPVRPELAIVKADVVRIDGMATPVLMVRNSGTAHGRLGASLTGIDAVGKKRDFSASSLPILPGETRMIPLTVDDGGDAVVAPTRSQLPISTIVFPLRIKGTISDTQKSYSFNGTFAP